MSERREQPIPFTPYLRKKGTDQIFAYCKGLAERIDMEAYHGEILNPGTEHDHVKQQGFKPTQVNAPATSTEDKEMDANYLAFLTEAIGQIPESDYDKKRNIPKVTTLRELLQMPDITEKERDMAWQQYQAEKGEQK